MYAPSREQKLACACRVCRLIVEVDRLAFRSRPWQTRRTSFARAESVSWQYEEDVKHTEAQLTLRGRRHSS